MLFACIWVFLSTALIWCPKEKVNIWTLNWSETHDKLKIHDVEVFVLKKKLRRNF